VTPHIGSASRATRARMAALAVENLWAGLSGTRMRHCANPSVYAASVQEGSVHEARGRPGSDS
jgi:phosphoglycerate dehydrogenase-like enzyme